MEREDFLINETVPLLLALFANSFSVPFVGKSRKNNRFLTSRFMWIVSKVAGQKGASITIRGVVSRTYSYPNYVFSTKALFIDLSTS